MQIIKSDDSVKNTFHAEPSVHMHRLQKQHVLTFLF